MSLLAEYKKEREDVETLEVDGAFATYKIFEERCHIQDVYVQPHLRRKNIASRLCDQIAKKAKEQGCKEIITGVCVGSRGDTNSLKAQLAYGMKLRLVDGQMIYLSKEI